MRVGALGAISAGQYFPEMTPSRHVHSCAAAQSLAVSPSAPASNASVTTVPLSDCTAESERRILPSIFVRRAVGASSTRSALTAAGDFGASTGLVGSPGLPVLTGLISVTGLADCAVGSSPGLCPAI